MSKFDQLLAARLWSMHTQLTVTAAPGDTSKCTKKPVSINILDGAGAPGLSGLQHLINIMAVAVISLAALCSVGGLAWIPLGKTIGIHGSGQHGRIMVVGGLAVAFVVGLIAVLINLAYSWGPVGICDPRNADFYKLIR